MDIYKSKYEKYKAKYLSLKSELNSAKERRNIIKKIFKNQTGGVSQVLYENLTCLITHEIMIDPVIASDGHTYERSAIIQWMKDNTTSPITREILTPILLPNRGMKNIIDKLITDKLLNDKTIQEYNEAIATQKAATAHKQTAIAHKQPATAYKSPAIEYRNTDYDYIRDISNGTMTATGGIINEDITSANGYIIPAGSYISLPTMRRRVRDNGGWQQEERIDQRLTTQSMRERVPFPREIRQEERPEQYGIPDAIPDTNDVIPDINDVIPDTNHDYYQPDNI